MSNEKFVVSWGIIVDAQNFDDAEKKGKLRMRDILGEAAFSKLEKATDELCVGEASEEDEETDTKE